MAKKRKAKRRPRGSRIGTGAAAGWRIYRKRGNREFVGTRVSWFHTGGDTFAVFRILRDESREETPAVRTVRRRRRRRVRR